MIARLLQRWRLYWAERHAIYFDLKGHKQLADRYWAKADEIKRRMK